ncbi:MAG: cyanophycin synthetase, partial [Candidatus Neomarinimicrobiota bacterium]
IITYGLSSQATFSANNIKFKKSISTYTLTKNRTAVIDIKLQIPGKHNIVNSLAAAALGFEMGVSPEIIAAGLGNYGGVRRRFEIKGISNSILVVDDYAHHPTEVQATLQAARDGWDRRIVAVFQPHLYSRTRDFYHEFAAAFMNSDIFIVTDVFPARESPIKGISGKLVADAARESGHRNVHYLPQLDDLSDFLDTITKPNDMVITLGAGNIWRYSEAYFKHLLGKEKK